MRKHKIQRRQADVYLITKERQEMVVLCLVFQHEPLEGLRGHGAYP